MNRTNLKNYAPRARREFIQAMKDRAAFYGLTASKIEPVVERGDVAMIGGREHPRAVAGKRKLLEARIKRHGYEQTMEAMAYTWFNRLVAIRFMELHGYLDHGYRVLSHPEGKPTPEILEHAEHVELPGLRKETVIDLKVAGNRESELYRLLVSAQCNALHTAMPFLFERIDDETELLVPDNLLHSDSLIRKLVNDVDEADWQQVEVIGWLYQFYISEKKDEVIGKVVASEDIPAATQLFTPNWIVKYLVQNTLGRQWLATYPTSQLRQKMEYYIEPAEQKLEVQEHLKAITPASLNPEELTLLDPACGSGHILVEAYDLFKAIYQERGYRAKDIPALILSKNLFGLEIDDRAAQLAAFALMMKARADDRRIFDSDAKPTVLAFEDSQGLNAADITHSLNAPINKDDVPSEYLFEEIEEDKDGLFSKKALAEKGHVSQDDIASLLQLFENAKTFGSLIQVSPTLATKLPEIARRLVDVLTRGDLTHTPAHIIQPLIKQAGLLTRQYDVVVANPPYMGGKGMSPTLKAFLGKQYQSAKADLFAAFVQRNLAYALPLGKLGFVTPYVWMFISTYEPLRRLLLDHTTITSLIQLEYNAFEPACIPVCCFTLSNHVDPLYSGTYIKLSKFRGADNQAPKTLEAIGDAKCDWRYVASSNDFGQLPGSPIAYWVSKKMLEVFESTPRLGEIVDARQGLATADNGKFLRTWAEVPLNQIGLGVRSREEAAATRMKWFPYNKGGEFRKWYGNQEYVVLWDDDGRELAAFQPKSVIRNPGYYFRESVSWSDVTSSANAFRWYPTGFIFDSTGHSAFPNSRCSREQLLCLLNTRFVQNVVQMLNPTMHFHVGYFNDLPAALHSHDLAERLATPLIEFAREDWDNFETSWNFREQPLLRPGLKADTLEEGWQNWKAQCDHAINETQQLEEENNRLLIDAYGLQDELSPIVTDDQITLYRPEREEDCKRLLSYAIGCMTGRYSLDEPGLIYADSGNEGFDARRHKTFRVDDDGIIPLLDSEWGLRDDAANRVVEFIGLAWPKEHLEENLTFIADSLGPIANEQARITIRRYLSSGFYKHHLSMYKRRPIYWLFSSGKQRAFQCLVYLHRYHEGTLARMRTEYVIPLQGKIASRIEQLEGDKAKATSTSHRNKLQKEQTDLRKQEAELLVFEEKLKHAADQKIGLDLNDGVKANYGKFGDLLAEAKSITGVKDDE
jgi:type II restriction/modification system DNA methylase subunit YeeA